MSSVVQSLLDFPVPPSRYHRQTLLPDFGEAGQQRISQGRILIVGIGALGCAAADQLARAGVGHLTILDRDLVEWTNLQRQTLFTEDDARQALPKAQAARARLAHVNSEITIDPLVRDLTPANAEQTLRDSKPHLILDGTDNFETRYLLNDLSVKHAIPFVYGGAVSTHGMATTFLPPGPCLRCIFEEAPPPGTTPTCDTAGVLAATIQTTASHQVVDALKILLGRQDLIAPTLTDFDVWSNSYRAIDITNSKHEDCPCCAKRQFDYLDSPAGDSATLCGQNAVQIAPASGATIDLDLLAARLRPHGTTTASRLFARCTLPNGLDLTLFPDGRAIVRGTKDPATARSLYAKLVGA